MKKTERKSTKNKLMEVAFILDMSGSMSGLESDTIGGFNSLCEKYSREGVDTIISTVLFDNRYEVLYDRVDIKAVRPLTEDEYQPRGCTALLDAIGKTIVRIEKNQRNMKPKFRADKVVLVITTDGRENASRHYSLPQIKKLIQGKRKDGWEFIFFGANIDTLEVAESMGMSRRYARSYSADSSGISDVYAEAEVCLSEIPF